MRAGFSIFRTDEIGSAPVFQPSQAETYFTCRENILPFWNVNLINVVCSGDPNCHDPFAFSSSKMNTMTCMSHPALLGKQNAFANNSRKDIIEEYNRKKLHSNGKAIMASKDVLHNIQIDAAYCYGQKEAQCVLGEKWN
jgi:hypothetical protein